jgi:multicomponent Na+:H+ antiporter subunit D
MSYWLPLMLIASSLLPGLLIFGLDDKRVGLRTGLNMSGAAVKIFLMVLASWGANRGALIETRIPFSLGWDLVFRIDDISLLFMWLSAVLWFLTTLYAIGYLEDSPNRSRFFGFFSLCVTSTMGISMAGNLFTFIVFYELLTLVTYPLVVHRGSVASLAAGRTYLLYTIGGGALLLLGVVWLHTMAGPVEFRHGGVLAPFESEHQAGLTVIFVLLTIGLAVKAAMVPLHGWLPQAMVAPAPVSALLHAVAVVKAGAFGIVRVIYDIFGIELAARLGLLQPLGIAASFTIIYGSIMALQQTEIKRRLAYSTVSQVSYIMLGAAMLGPAATTGGLVHLVHQGLMKITLFFCAGNLSETLGIYRISQLKGAGRRMPLTMAAFTLGAFGMIGIPPMAGFVSKWYLGLGAVNAGEQWVLGVLVASSVLNAAYFLPLIHAAWFEDVDDREAESCQGRVLCEAKPLLLIPTLATALLSLLAGLAAGFDLLSPLGAVSRIIEGMYPP